MKPFIALDQQIEKSQEVRLIDVFILAPFMVWFGMKAEGVPKLAKTAMIVSGILTALYNGRNYLINTGKITKEEFPF